MLLDNPGSSTLMDKTHRGPNQAGNKSLLSYNSAIGVPGYTGFCSTSHAVVLPIKCAEHTGRPVDDATRAAVVRATVDGAKAQSEYAGTFRKVPSAGGAERRAGGGYWITQPTTSQSVPFTATSTYREEVLNPGETAARKLDASLGVPCTLSQYRTALATAPRAQPADPAAQCAPAEAAYGAGRPSTTAAGAARRPACMTTSSGDLVGYQTTSQSLRLTRAPPQPPAGATAEKQDATITRYSTMPHAMAPTMYGHPSTYDKDFGADPMSRSAPTERFQTRCTTGQDLAAGTTRMTNNPPGYTGHIAASKYNTLAMAQSAAADERLDVKSDMLLYQLDQYGRCRLPGYTGYKPGAAQNITTVQPSQGPPKCTTSGAAALQGVKYGVPKIDNTHYTNSRAGILTFFTSAGPYVSDNGLSNAQEYYKLVKPGNDFKHSSLCHVTHYGKRFNSHNSLV